jgi:maltooligosyltrehalose synthase
MGKIVNLSEKEQKETEILSKRIMPKTDFEKIIEHDKLYFNTLNQALEFNLIKQNILGETCQKLMAKQTKESIEANIHTLTDWAETQLKVLDMQGKLRIQQKLIEDKETHFQNVFMPQFIKESKEAKEHSREIFDKVQDCIDAEREEFKEIVHKMRYELAWWNKCSENQQNNDEFLIQIYKPLKRLVSAYEDRQKELDENAKYSK